jgi:hypothetical protein
MQNKVRYFYILLAGLILALFFACKKEPVYNVPAVVISPVTTISTNGAVSGGEIISEGSGSVTLRGVCWSTGPNPTPTDSKTADGSGTGSFTSAITGLLPGQAYYIRAYAINAYGTGYSSQSTFTTLATVPTVITLNITGTGPVSASVTGNVSSDGGAGVTAKGVCWSTNQNPTVADSKTNDGTGAGSFTSTLSGLNSGMIYYARAYATNSQGTAYGKQVIGITLNGSNVERTGHMLCYRRRPSARASILYLWVTDIPPRTF